MRKRGCLFLLLAAAGLSLGQATNPKTTFRATTAEGSLQLIVETRGAVTGQINPALVKALSEKRGYALYRISLEDPERPRSTLLNFEDHTRGSIACNSGTGICTINLKDAFEPGSYVLKINGLGSFAANASDAVPVFFGLKAPPNVATGRVTAAIVPSIDRSPGKVRVQSKSPLTASPELILEDTTLRRAKDRSKVIQRTTSIEARVENPEDRGEPMGAQSTAKEFTLLLDDDLEKGKGHELNIASGILDAKGEGVKPEGIVEVPGLKAPDAASFLVRMLAEAANHKKPFFNFYAKYDAQNRIPVRQRCILSVNRLPCYWQPQIELDLGLGEGPKSNNSLIIDLPLRATVFSAKLKTFSPEDPIFDADEEKGEAATPRYYGWRHTPFSRGDIYFSFGPKFEIDRGFRRINVLGSVRLDFRSHRMLATIAHKRQMLAGGPPYGLSKQQLSQVEVRNGFSFVPFIGGDLGRKVTAEVVQDANVRFVAPKQSIFRIFGGFKGVYEWQIFTLPMSMTIDEKVYYFVDSETVGSVNDDYVTVRRLKGFHHRGLLSFDVFLNPARRYSFNMTYENGRNAPNFEYQSRLTAGLRVLF